MDAQKRLLYQFTRNGLIYSIAVTPTDRYNLPEVPATLQLKKQFIDIAENHAAFVAEKQDAAHTIAAAAEQRREYFAEREAVPAT